MSMKLKIGFTVSAETLFGLMAKMLPIEDLSVEELLDAPPARQIAKSTPPKPKLKMRRAPRLGVGYPINLGAGANKVIMDALADGEPHRFKDLTGVIAASGYSPTGIGGKLNRLLAHKVVVKLGGGFWRLAQPARKTA